MTNKSSLVQNPARQLDTAEYEPYTPQYRALGIDPEQIDFANNTPSKEVRLASIDEMTEDNPRLPRVSVDVNYSDSESDKKVEVNPESKNTNLKQKEDNSNKDYVLVVKDEIIQIGSLSQIEETLKEIFYNDHPLCNSGVTIDDLIVLKKLKIKVGIFVE